MRNCLIRVACHYAIILPTGRDVTVGLCGCTKLQTEPVEEELTVNAAKRKVIQWAFLGPPGMTSWTWKFRHRGPGQRNCLKSELYAPTEGSSSTRTTPAQVTQAPPGLSDTAVANMQRALAVVSLAFAFSARALNRPVTAAAARVKRLSRDEEIKLADIAQRNGRRARRARAALVAANGGLAVALARAYANPPYATADDLAQEAYLGLARAAERFDGTRGVRFSTYATPWVRAACAAWLRRTAYSTRVPERVATLAARARRASTRLEAADGVAPSLDDIALAVNSSAASVDAALAAAARSTGAELDAPAIGDVSLGATLADATELGGGDLRSDLGAALAAALGDDELRVVRLRYGLDDGIVRSTRDCAQVLGVGRETVRQTCLRAFRRLRGTHAGEALLDYVD